MSNALAKPVLLLCEHTLWFRAAHLPLPGEEVWCAKCDGPSSVPKLHRDFATYYPDGDWYCYEKSRARARGECRRCGHEFVAPFAQVRSHMERHYRLQCDERANELLIQLVNLPPNSPPPF